MVFGVGSSEVKNFGWKEVAKHQQEKGFRDTNFGVYEVQLWVHEVQLWGV